MIANGKTEIQFYYGNGGKPAFILVFMLALAFGLRYEGLTPAQIGKGSGATMQIWWEWVLFLIALGWAILFRNTDSWSMSREGVCFHIGFLNVFRPWNHYPFAGYVPSGVLWFDGKPSKKKALYFSSKPLIIGKRPPRGCHIMEGSPELATIFSLLCPFFEINEPPLRLPAQTYPVSPNDLQRKLVRMSTLDVLHSLLLVPGLFCVLFLQSPLVYMTMMALSGVLYLGTDKWVNSKYTKMEKDYQIAILVSIQKYREGK